MGIKWLVEYSYGEEVYIRSFDKFRNVIYLLHRSIQAPAPITYYKVWMKEGGVSIYTCLISETFSKEED